MALFLVRDLGWSEAKYGLLATVNTLLVVAFEVPLNSAMARWPARRTLPLGAVLTGAGFGLLAFAHAPGMVIVSVVVWTFGEIVLFPGLNAAVADLAPEARRGEYMGLYMMAFNLAFAIGPWAGTVVLERWGGPTLWTGAFLAALLSAILLSRTGAAVPGPRGREAMRTNPRADPRRVLLATLSASCRKEADPVRATIDALAKAADDRDADAAGDLLAASYADAEHADRAAALATIRRYFAAYERISASFSDLEVDRKPDLARVTFRPRSTAHRESSAPSTRCCRARRR